MNKLIAVSVVAFSVGACTLQAGMPKEEQGPEPLHFSDIGKPNNPWPAVDLSDAGYLHLPVDLDACANCDAGTDAGHDASVDAAPEASVEHDAGVDASEPVDSGIDSSVQDSGQTCHNECTNGAQSHTLFNIWINGMWEKSTDFAGKCSGQKCDMIQDGIGGWITGVCVSISK